MKGVHQIWGSTKEGTNPDRKRARIFLAAGDRPTEQGVLTRTNQAEKKGNIAGPRPTIVQRQEDVCALGMPMNSLAGNTDSRDIQSGDRCGDYEK